MLAFEDSDKSPAIIKVVGVGGAGMNAVERMVHLKLKGVELICMNTDEQVLHKSSAHIKVHLGNKITRGMGAGANPEVGSQAAIEDRDKILNVLKGADMVFITAGMGGGTGTGASPIVAEVARELKALTVGVISLPFKAEGGHKMQVARKGQSALREKVDTLITIPNDAIFKVIDKTTPINLAFKAIDDVLAKSVIGISDIINSTGHVNVDFADVRTVMSQNGDAVIGTGEGHGETRVSDALQHAIHHPLLEGRSIDGAKAVLINVVGGSDLSMHEFNEIQETIHSAVSDNAQIIVGFTEDDTKEDQVSITVIATGFQKEQKNFDAPVQKIDKNGYYDSRMDRGLSRELPREQGRELTREQAREQGRENIRNIDQKKTGTDHSGYPYKDEQPRQQGLNFPNLESDLENLNIPAYLRKNK